jgi:outer membrane protein OmpA-like peptidoglycan-associated protein
MKNIRHRALSVAALAVMILAGAVVASGQDFNKIPNGQQVKKFKGIVIKRESDSFTMSETMGGTPTVVVLTPSTEVKSHKRGVFRGSKDYGASYILRGLRLEVDGVGNAEGQLVADKVRFDEQDLRTAQALKTTVDPMEAELRDKLKQQQEESERLAGQLNETQAVAAQARTEAAQASEAAKKAQDTADYANNRINGLDDFDVIKTITVNFATNSAVLNAKAKATIDEAADWVKTQNTKGWVVAVIGYADTTGNTARNRALSERRANNVIYYLVTQKGLKPQRLVQPFGYGQLEPVAENKTAAGRAKNRRVEIRLMVNKGISGNVGKTQ